MKYSKLFIAVLAALALAGCLTLPAEPQSAIGYSGADAGGGGGGGAGANASKR